MVEYYIPGTESSNGSCDSAFCWVVSDAVLHMADKATIVEGRGVESTGTWGVMVGIGKEEPDTSWEKPPGTRCEHGTWELGTWWEREYGMGEVIKSTYEL